MRHRRRTKHRMGCASENTPTHPSPQGGGSSPATAVAENLSPPPHRSVSSPHCPRAGRDRERTVCGDRIGWRGSRPSRRSSGRPDVSPVRGGDESCGGCPVPQSGSGYCGTGEDPAVRRNEVKNPGRAGGARPCLYLRTTVGAKPRRRSPFLPHPPEPDGCRDFGAASGPWNAICDLYTRGGGIALAGFATGAGVLGSKRHHSAIRQRQHSGTRALHT